MSGKGFMSRPDYRKLAGAMNKGVLSREDYRKLAKGRGVPGRRRWSSATPTTCPAGHRHASKMEARVCARLTLECRARGERLLQQVRFPLLSIGSKATGKPETICVDFVVVGGGTWRAIDAKCQGRVSRDWRLRAAAFEASFGRTVEEVDR